MPTEQDMMEGMRLIQSFYDFAGVPLPSGFEVNERVAEVFGIMLNETRKCSKAFGWVPTPPAGPASITWLAMQLGKGVFNSYRSRLSFTCARHVINVWGEQLQMGSLGIASGRLPAWA